MSRQRERAERTGYSSVYAYMDDQRAAAWAKEEAAYEASPRGRARRKADAEEQAKRDARSAAEAAERKAEHEARAAAQAAEAAQAKIAAREVLDRLWPERMAAIERARAERRAALEALDPWALRDAQNRAASRTHTACAALHVAYLHLVKGLEWSDAVSRVRQAPADAWWTDELVPMSEDERAARRVLGLLYPEPA